MAKQVGIIPLSGAIDTLTFSKSRDGYHAGKKTSLTGKKIATSPNFLNTRLNNIEFGRAGKASLLLINAVRSLRTGDRKLFSRLLKLMMQALKADPINPRGFRNLIDGDLSKVKKFEFNDEHPLFATLRERIISSIDRMTGRLTVTLDPFVPKLSIIGPSLATHFKLSCAGIALDFNGDDYILNVQETGLLPLNNVATAPIVLTNMMPVASPHPLAIILGIQFIEVKLGVEKTIANGSYNAMQLVKIDTV